MTPKRPIVAILLAPFALLAGCRLLSPHPPQYEAFELPSGVVILDLTIPWHEHLLFARPGDKLTLHYQARLGDGVQIDSSWDRGEPVQVRLGDGDLPEGLEQGLVGMRQFARRRLTVPPELAYGSEGVPGIVPPGATVVFDVELMAVRRPKPAEADSAQTVPSGAPSSAAPASAPTAVGARIDSAGIPTDG
ncbi:FKBP-type peptidyl-prolyl cis-trans isomerase [Engelhardtia mirabilis]|uniref:Peptidyl-prolyl cis-trans isomerase n=1 Tax=Engelhardtia mirabilis TaxID=2528011 RepID=A0A518BQX4_9BACT|nr:FK506-binding protein [Planctomycetes bacterium Pla133]QDV03713.1 FK506-binding protein [Planctomycetes bacterium Pla86]